MRKFLMFCALTLMVSAPAFAQWGDEKLGSAGFGIGMTSPSSNDFDSFADRSVSLNGYVTRQFAGPLGWRVEGGYDRFKLDGGVKDVCSLEGVDCSDPTVFRVNGGVQMGGYGSGAAQPYGFATFGAYNVDTGDPLSDSETDLGMALGTGINWAVSETWGIGVDFHYNGFWPKEEAGEDLDMQWYSVASIQFFWRW